MDVVGRMMGLLLDILISRCWCNIQLEVTKQVVGYEVPVLRTNLGLEVAREIIPE